MGSSAQRVLILPAGLFQAPAIRTARAMGLQVLAIDRDADAPGLRLADIAEAIDPSDIQEAVRFAKRHNVEAVFTMACDPCVVPCAYIADALEIPGLSPESALLTRNKLLARRKLAQTLPHYCPKFCAVSSVAGLKRIKKEVGLPAVLKPVEGEGSKGVICVDSARELEKAVQYSLGFSKNGVILAEERLRGREVSVETITVDGVTHVAAVTDKITTAQPFCVEIGHTLPTDLAPAAQRMVEAAACQVVDAFGIASGAAHTEFYLREDQCRLVEIGARLGGGCIASHLTPLATGIDMVAAALEIALGRRPVVKHSKAAGAAIRFIQAGPGQVASVTGLDAARAAPGVQELVLNCAPGDVIFPLQNSGGRIGYVIASGHNRAEAVLNAERAVASIGIACSPS